MDTVMSLEKHLASYHLSQDTGGWPDVHCQGVENNFNKHTHYCVIAQASAGVCLGDTVTCLTVVHPVEYDLWSSVPARHNIASHFTLCLSCQAKVQDLRDAIVWFIILYKS